MFDQFIFSFGIICTITIIFGLLTRNAKGNEAGRDETHKILSVPEWCYWLIGGFGLLVCFTGLGIVCFYKEEAIAGYGAIGFGLIFLIPTFALKSFCISDIKWNEHGILGPKGRLGLTCLDYKWEEARQIGYAKNGNLCIIFADEQKLYILAFSAGWTELIEDIQIYAPHVKVDPKIIEAIQP